MRILKIHTNSNHRLRQTSYTNRKINNNIAVEDNNVDRSIDNYVDKSVYNTMH